MFKLEEGWATVWLFAGLMVVAAWGVEAPGWAPGLWTASLVGIVGVLAGLALSKSRFNGWVAALFAAGYGLFTVGFLICLTLFRGDWHYRTLELLIRVNNFLYYALHGGTSRDILPFTVMVGLIFWVVAVAGAWGLFRRGTVWPALLPGGVILLINSYYYVGEELELYLAAYLVLALLLLARMNLLAQEHEWQGARVAYTPEMRFEFLRAGLIAAVILVTVAWVGQRVTTASASPQAEAAWRQVSGTWSVVRENFERLFNSVRNPGITAEDFYGDSLTLGGASSLTDRQMMTVALAPIAAETGPDGQRPAEDVELPDVPRYYWRAAAYQQYLEGRWQTGDNLEFREQDPARGALRQASYRLRVDLSATFTSFLAASSRLYVLPQPRLVDRPSTFEVIVGPGGLIDPVSVRAQTLLTGDDRRYRVVASVSVADQQSLRVAGTDYPEWVRAYYLQLPETITPRTRALARQIVTEAGATTPFDQAQAITRWLRQNITYDLAIEAPPQGAEPIDWFLFESRRGYCNYYASAMVLMLRSLDIPARMAVGFAQGEFDPVTGQYVVRERNAHAWPEVYFPNYGWIEFEPTGSEPPLERPERTVLEDTNAVAPPTPAADDAPPLERNDRDALDDASTGQDRPAIDVAALLEAGRRLSTAALVIALLTLAALGWLVSADLIGWESLGRPGRQVLRWLGRVVPTAVTQAYLELERAARWLGLKLPPYLTPRERAGELSAALPAARPAIETITAQYMAEQYSPYPEIANGSLALGAWRDIRSRVWGEGILKRLRRWIRIDLRSLLRDRDQREAPDERWERIRPK